MGVEGGRDETEALEKDHRRAAAGRQVLLESLWLLLGCPD